MRSFRSTLAIVTTAGLCLAGCGSSGAGPAGPAAPGGGARSTGGGGGAAAPAGGGGAGSGAITFHAKVSVTGAYSFTDSYDVAYDPSRYAGEADGGASAPKSCADVGRLGTSAGGSGSPPSFAAPTPGGVMASGRNSLDFQADADDYTGPKTYRGKQIDSSSGMEISNTPTLPDDGGGDLNFGDMNASSSLTVNADGSGSLSILGWEDAGSRTVSGTVAWTCSG